FAIGLIEIPVQRTPLVLGQALPPLFAALLLRIPSALRALVTRTGGGAGSAFLRLRIHVRCLVTPSGGCSRPSEEAGCNSEHEQNSFHVSILAASIAPVRVVIPIIEPAFCVVLLHVDLAREIVETRGED